MKTVFRRRMASLVVLGLLLGTVASCTAEPAPSGPVGSDATASSPQAAAEPPAGASSAPGGCGKTPVWFGGMPPWTASANPPAGTPYALSREGNLVAVLFVQPLRAGENVNNPANKILWISREPRQGAELRLVLRRADGTGDPVETVEYADSSPGEIYPSLVDVPTPGCWSVTATWGPNTATLELAYE
jgi:hypothetical protein